MNEKKPLNKTESDTFRVLVPVDLSRDDWSQLQPVEVLSGAEVVLLGVYGITDQVSPEQARDQFEVEAQSALKTLADRFRQANLEVETTLVFAVDVKDAVNRVADDMACDAVLTWNEELVFSSVAVFHRGEAKMDKLMDVVAGVMAEQSQEVDMVHLYDEDTEEEEVTRRRNLLGQQRGDLVSKGIPSDQINIVLESVSDIDRALEKKASQYDVIIMGETEPSVRSRLFGSRHELVSDHAKGVVLIVRAKHRDLQK